MGLGKDIKEKLKVNPKNLNAELVEQPGLFAYHAYQMTKKNQELEELELDLNILIAKKDKKTRNMFEETGVKYSEKKIEIGIDADNEVIKMKKKIIKLNTEYNILKGITRAYEQRKDILISLSANIREERKSDVSLRDKE